MTSPQCSGCLRSSPSSSPRKALCYYLLLDSSWVPTVKSSLGKRKACFSAPTHCPLLPFLPSLPPQSCSERSRWALRPHSNPQQMRTEPALRSLGTRWAKTGVTVEGSGVAGALAECRAAPPPHRQVFGNHPRQAGRWTQEAGSTCWLITVISEAIKWHGLGQPLKEGPVSPDLVFVAGPSPSAPPAHTQGCGRWMGPHGDDGLHPLCLGTCTLSPVTSRKGAGGGAGKLRVSPRG